MRRRTFMQTTAASVVLGSRAKQVEERTGRRLEDKRMPSFLGKRLARQRI